MGSGIMNAPAGKFWKEHAQSKHLDRPRLEGSHSNQKTTCVSKGVDGGGGGDDKKMAFGSRDPKIELWGVQKKTYVQQAPREDKPTKKMPTPDKKVG